jgi:hypothetical protein
MLNDKMNAKMRLYNKTNKYRNQDILNDMKEFMFEMTTIGIFVGILLIVALIKLK